MPFPPIPNVGRIIDSANNPRRWEPVEPPVPQPPQASGGLSHEPTHQASQPSGRTPASANQLTNHVPPGGLHAVTPWGAFAEAINEMTKALAQETSPLK